MKTMKFRGRGMFMAGIVGALAGMYIMSLIDGNNPRQMRHRKKTIVRTARSGTNRLTNAYMMGKNAVQNGVSFIRQ